MRPVSQLPSWRVRVPESRGTTSVPVPPGRRYRQGVDRRFLRPGWVAGHLLVVAAVLTCLRLGWWQWQRTHETTGTAQNFGYALLWPAFGAAFIYMWMRFLHLEVLKDVEDEEETDRALRELLAAEGSESGERPAGVIQVAGTISSINPDAHAPVKNGDRADERDTIASVPITDNNTLDEPLDSGPDRVVGVRSDQRRSSDRQGSDRQRPSQGIVLSVATVGADEDDPELTAYNQALAALAEEDRRRAR